MEDQSVRFYLDELMPGAIAEQLNQRGIDTITVRDLGLLGKTDAFHLELANELGRVLCTMDDDFVRLFNQGAEHSGIVFGSRKDLKSIGTWVRFPMWVHRNHSRDDLKNHIEYLKVV